MRSSLRIAAKLAGASLAAAGLFGCEASPARPSADTAIAAASSSAERAAPAPASHEQPAPIALVGKALPRIALKGVEGEASTLHGADGKPTVLVLWSTWCQACLRETAQLTTWAQSRSDVELRFVNVDGIAGTPIDPANVRDRAHGLGLTGPIWTASIDDLPALGVKTCPTSFVVDARGVVQAAREGYKGADEMNQWLDTKLRAL